LKALVNQQLPQLAVSFATKLTDGEIASFDETLVLEANLALLLWQGCDTRPGILLLTNEFWGQALASSQNRL